MIRQFAFTLAVLLLHSPVFADGFYIGGGIGIAMFDDAVDASAPSLVALGEIPGEVSLNGRPFDSNETASGLTVGWHAKDWLSVELGYTDFGNTGQSLPVGLFSQVPIITPAAPPFPTPPNFGGVASFPIALNDFAAALSVEEWSVAAKFRRPLISDLSANWSIGVTRANFDADGQLRVNEVISLNPLILNSLDLPYASPKDETGYRLGFGFEWRFNDRFSAEIAYKRHDTQVIVVETVILQLQISL